MSGEHVTVMNLTSRTYVLSAPLGMEEATLRIGDNRIPRAAWEHSVKCSPSLLRDPKLFVVPEAEARVERTSEPEALIALDVPVKVQIDLVALSISEAKRAIEQCSDLDALDAWTNDARKSVATAAQKRIDSIMGAE